MKILVAGASGFIGRTLLAALRENGHEVCRLVRSGGASDDSIQWNPSEHALDPAAMAGCDAVINLAGENVGAGRWTARRRTAIRCSRIDTTATLVEAIRREKSRPALLLNASAVGCYGDRGETELTEMSSFGTGFLPDVCRAWETEAQAAAELGCRVVCLRFGVVLGDGGGVLAKMLPLFRLGLGGRLGSGRQWMSWIHRDDVVGAIVAALGDSRFTGPVNVVAPAPIRNADFTAALAHAVHRPALLPAPAWALRAALGSMADEALLASTRAVPARFLALGYAFRFTTADAALRASMAPSPSLRV